MSQRAINSATTKNGADSLPAMPLKPAHWRAVVDAMRLSPREADVAALKIRGAQLKEIAAILGIEMTTVRAFQDRICAKAGIRRHEFFAHILRIAVEVQHKSRRQ
jgi:DNA-binding CsgD family transcriptional regulator